jgi:hypothetical protein
MTQSFARYSVAFLLLANSPAFAQQVDFTYHGPGDLLSGSGRVDRHIYVPGMLFPLQVGPNFNNQHAFANSQIHGPETFAYPWRDTYCEEREWTMPLCPSGKGHQGDDIRPNQKIDKHWIAVAMDDAVVTNITHNTTVELRATDGKKTCRYLHMDFASIGEFGLTVNSTVRRGDPVGKVSNIMGGTPSTSIHLHFDCHQVINGRIVHVPVFTSLISAYRTAWGLDPANNNGELVFDPMRERSTGFSGSVGTTPGTNPDPSQPKTWQSRNYGALTPQTEPPNWPQYIKTWPHLNLGLQIRDKFGKVIPAFFNDEAGIGIWWYWMVIRAGFGAQGKVSFEDIAFRYSGAMSRSDPAVDMYVSNYSGTSDNPGISRLYFSRFVPRTELLNLADMDTRWKIAQTIFQHEGGKPVPFDRATFERGIALGTSIIDPHAGGTAPGGIAPGETTPGGTAPGGTIPGGTAPGGTPGATLPGGTAPGGVGPVGIGSGSPICPACIELVVNDKYVLRIGNQVDGPMLNRLLDLLDRR